MPGELSDEEKKRLIEKFTVAFPMTPRRPVSDDPLRRNIDYQGVSRRTLVVSMFECKKCGFFHPDEKYEHSEEECLMNHVHQS